MSMTKRLDAYSDVRDAFNYALAHQGGQYVVPNKSMATRWRHRAYYFRTLIREQNGTGMSEYDSIVVSVRPNTSGDAWVCSIELHPWHIGVFIPNDGRPLEAVAPIPYDSKEAAIARMAGTILKPEHHEAMDKALGTLSTYEVPERIVDTVSAEDADAWARGED